MEHLGAVASLAFASLAIAGLGTIAGIGTVTGTLTAFATAAGLGAIASLGTVAGLGTLAGFGLGAVLRRPPVLSPASALAGSWTLVPSRAV